MGNTHELVPYLDHCKCNSNGSYYELIGPQEVHNAVSATLREGRREMNGGREGGGGGRERGGEEKENERSDTRQSNRIWQAQAHTLTSP